MYEYPFMEAYVVMYVKLFRYENELRQVLIVAGYPSLAGCALELVRCEVEYHSRMLPREAR